MGSEIKRVVLVGAGGVGFYLAVALRRDVPDVELIVYDDDNLEGGFGAQRLPYVANKLTKKVDFLKGFVRMVMRDSPPLVKPQKVTVQDIVDETQFPYSWWEGSLVVDASDMGLEVRKPLWDSFRSRGAKMLRVSYDGNGIVVVARGLPLASKPGGGYSQVPSMAQSLWAGGVGAAAVEKLLRGEVVSDYQMEIK